MEFLQRHVKVSKENDIGITMKEILIIGAGAVGTQLACLLSKSGYQTTLIDKAADIIVGGASAAANLGHYDGFEYCHSSHRKTGEMCIDGGLTFPLFYQPHIFENTTANPNNPIKFLVSENSLSERTKNNVLQGFSWGDFVNNAQHMQSHYKTRHQQIRSALSLSHADTNNMLYGDPNIMGSLLDASEYPNVNGIHGGVTGIGAVVSMPMFYATLKDAIRKEEEKSTLTTQFEQSITAIARNSDGKYIVTDSMGESKEYDMIFLAAGHENPALVAKTAGAIAQQEGTYYLNLMTYISIKPNTPNLNTYFTIQQDDGCMLCIHQMPTEEENGFGALYYPSVKGSQFLYSPSTEYTPDIAEQWSEYMQYGIPDEAQSQRTEAILQQAHSIYPFLEDNIIVEKIIPRAVFNAASKDSMGGLDRRVREAKLVADGKVTDDGQVVAITSPKWTTSLATAIEAVDYVEQHFNRRTLPRSEEGFTPQNIDIITLSHQLNFKDSYPSPYDAFHYVAQVGLPHDIIGAGQPFISQTRYGR